VKNATLSIAQTAHNKSVDNLERYVMQSILDANDIDFLAARNQPQAKCTTGVIEALRRAKF
jgi:hypothetical protein